MRAESDVGQEGGERGGVSELQDYMEVHQRNEVHQSYVVRLTTVGEWRSISRVTA